MTLFGKTPAAMLDRRSGRNSLRRLGLTELAPVRYARDGGRERLSGLADFHRRSKSRSAATSKPRAVAAGGGGWAENARDRELSPKLRDAILFDNSSHAPQYGSILVIDENGKLKLSSTARLAPGSDFSDRDFFARHRDDPDLGIRSQRLTTGRSMAISSWFSAAVLNDPDGASPGRHRRACASNMSSSFPWHQSR